MFDAVSVAQQQEFLRTSGCMGEGMIIAVIDTELDVTQNMFTPIDKKNTRLGYKDIERMISDGIGFSGKFTADDVYISSKLPFVFSYSGESISDPEVYHGTHVAGIAAGNRVMTRKGIISGIAPDAQIIFMGVSDADKNISDDAVLAAMEDAVRLGADVINMSFGDEYESFDLNDPLRAAVAAAEDAGIIVCQSAGNTGDYQKPAVFPHFTTVSESCNYSGVMSVAASVNRNGLKEEEFEWFSFMGTKINYYIPYNEEFTQRYSWNISGSYELVFADVHDLESCDLTGKIAAVLTETEEEYELLRSSVGLIADKGAAALIYTVPDGVDVYSESYKKRPSVPVAAVTSKCMRYILEAEGEKVIGIPELQDPYGDIMSFSSYGVTSSLELEPDITAPGGYIYSA